MVLHQDMLVEHPTVAEELQGLGLELVLENL